MSREQREKRKKSSNEGRKQQHAKKSTALADMLKEGARRIQFEQLA
jgi:hypothetical protein